MTPERIKEIQAMLDAATPGPWEVIKAEIGNAWVIDADEKHDEVVSAGYASCWDYGVRRFTDATLIAAAPTLIAELLAEVERLRVMSELWALKYYKASGPHDNVHPLKLP